MANASLIVTDSTGSKTFKARTDQDGNFASVISLDTNAKAFRASASFTPYATSAATVIRFAGHAAVIARIKRIFVGGVSTASGSALYTVQRVTAVGTGGTAVLPTIAKLSPRSGAASCSVTHYTTAAQSQGTASGGPLSTLRIGTAIVSAPTTSGFWGQQSVFPEGGAPIGNALEVAAGSVSGDAIEIGVNPAANLPTATVLEYTIEWEEYTVSAE